ncbi:MAG: hypothetical protein H7Y27_10710 [Gemmatimonadaceae bacterium]|nr:hypothetical protein [Chitinophagaceae bacterium]
MRPILALILFCPLFSSAQYEPPQKEEDHLRMEINNQIFRLLIPITVERFGGIGLQASYEHVIRKPFTFVIKGGPTFYAEDPDVFGINGRIAGEVRYYFNLFHRIKKDKTVKNFTAGYLSIEPFAVTGSYQFLRKGDIYEPPPESGAFINIGYQWQFKRSYANIFFGTRFPGKVYSESVDATDLLHAGLVIGKVF